MIITLQLLFFYSDIIYCPDFINRSARWQPEHPGCNRGGFVALPVSSSAIHLQHRSTCMKNAAQPSFGAGSCKPQGTCSATPSPPAPCSCPKSLISCVHAASPSPAPNPNSHSFMEPRAAASHTAGSASTTLCQNFLNKFRIQMKTNMKTGSKYKILPVCVLKTIPACRSARFLGFSGH